MVKYFILFVIYFGATTGILFGQSLPAIQLDRPDQTECPFITPKKYIQIENGFTIEHIDQNQKSFSYPSTLWKYGVNEKFELRLITELVSEKTNDTIHSGFSPITIGFKTSLFEEKGIIPKTSFIGHITTSDIGSEEFRTSYIAPSFRFTMQHTLTPKVALSYNLGAEWNGENAEHRYIYTLTTGFSLTDEIGFSALPGGYRFSDGKFYQLNTDGFYWSSTNSGSNTAWYRYFIDFQDNTYRKNSFNRTVGASLRCIKDIPPQGIFPEILPSKNIFFEGKIDSAKSYLTEVNSHFSENKLIIYPNPSDGKFSLVFQDYEIKKPLKLILTDGLGRTIKFFYPIDLENNMELDLTKFIGNVFFLRVIYEGETMTKKMLKH